MLRRSKLKKSKRQPKKKKPHLTSLKKVWTKSYTETKDKKGQKLHDESWGPLFVMQAGKTAPKLQAVVKEKWPKNWGKFLGRRIKERKVYLREEEIPTKMRGSWLSAGSLAIPSVGNKKDHIKILREKDRVIRDLAQAMYEQVTLGVEHGDFHPGNILFYEDEHGHMRAKVIDYEYGRLTSQTIRGKRERPYFEIVGKNAPHVSDYDALKDHVKEMFSYKLEKDAHGRIKITEDKKAGEEAAKMFEKMFLSMIEREGRPKRKLRVIKERPEKPSGLKRLKNLFKRFIP